MRFVRWIPVLTCLLVAGVPPAAAAEREPYVLPGAEQRLLTASGSGRQYQVFIATPPQPPPADGYPVIYVLDGNAMFLTVVEAVRAYARRRDDGSRMSALVVGIGYPPGTDVSEARTYDLTSPSDAAVPVERPPSRRGEARPRHPTGGAPAFLDFIQDDLKPAIARDHPVDSRRQALIGHSLAGLFVLDTLTRRPDAFQTYVAMSASFWFGDHGLLPRIEAFASARSADDAPGRVLLTVGEYEERPRPEAWADHPARAAEALDGLRRRAQVTHARETAKRLAGAHAMLADFVEIAGEDHGTVIPASIGRGVGFILTGPFDVPAVPTAEEYMRLGAEGRYRLRMQVRALPDLHRIPWLNGLKASLQSGLDKDTHAELHEERQRMDRRYGSRPHEVNAD